MAMKISNQEKIDLDMYTKWLAKQAVEIIVESRLGSTVSTPSIPQAGTAWFNLNVNNVSGVGDETKKFFTSELLSRLPLCVEISLRTPEKDHMVLECWCLDLLPQLSEPSTRIAPNIVYNRMGILLKSLVSVTRVTPAYKLSRRQGADSYVILYHIYMGEPQLHTLGEGFKKNIVGQIGTPMGTLQLSVLYRTKMTISPTQPGRDSRMMLKSDHFNTNLSPKSRRYNQNDEKTTNLSDTMKLGAFADYEKNRNFEPNFSIPEAPFSKLFAERISPDKQPEKNSEDNESISNGVTDESKTTEVEKEKNGNNSSPSLENRLDALTMVSTNDDFIMVDLKTPFASTNEKSELGRFYREWQAAPPLQTFVDLPSLEELDLTKQLETFESDLNQYDTLVQSLCQSPNDE